MTRKVPKGRQGWAKPGEVWGDLHLMACISLMGFQHGADLEIRFWILKSWGVVQIQRANGEGDERRPEEK